MRLLEPCIAALSCAALAACSRTDVSDAPPTDAGTNAAMMDEVGEPSAPMGPCAAVEQWHPNEGRTHVAVCSYVAYDTKPPNSGNHYPIWAAYMFYSNPVPEGFWVHNLEHGTIVISYNCDVPSISGSSCKDDVAAAEAMFDALPADPLCTALDQGVNRRSIVVADPNLDVRIAASAWQWTLRAGCFDTAVFQSFALRHYDQGPEEICSNGEDLSSGIEADCGAP